MFCGIVDQLHIFAGAIALFAGPVQFLRAVRMRWVGFHRLCGRIYMITVLISSPLALVISFHSTLLWAVIATASQSVFWLVTTVQAYRAIKTGQVSRHRACMMMSYALTLSAPVLRLGIVIAENGFGINYQKHYDLMYPILAWVSFLPFLAVWFLTKDILKKAG